VKFEKYNIAPDIKKSLQEMGFNKPTDIQFKAIPSILKGEDVLAIAQTGTGKTAAFAIPIMHKLLYRKSNLLRNSVRCLIMVPTRELAIQITKACNDIARYTDLVIISAFGGIDSSEQKEELSEGVDVLIATPGRMFDLRAQGFINFKYTEILVLDEADHMLALGFIKDIRDVIQFLPKRHQTLFFSATIDEKIKDLAYSLVTNPIRIQISPKDPVSKNVHHAVAYIEMDDKRFFLERFIRENIEKKILVFVRTKVRAERVCKAMARVGIQTITMHGDKAQEDRIEVMQQFSKGEVKVLIATDISARGIDIAGIEFVINYDLPDVAENYVHRIGRTGRGMQKGEAISFCAEEEKEMLQEIEKFTHTPIEIMNINKLDYSLTLALQNEGKHDWQKLIEEAEKSDLVWKKKNPKKNKKK
jgi:ATP-dependent RNA helicase RhlE